MRNDDPVSIAPLFTETRKLTASNGRSGDLFGISVAISGETAVVRTLADSGRGTAYIFARRQGGTEGWGEVKRLVAVDAIVPEQTNMSVAISGNTVVIGHDLDNAGKGLVYIYDRNKGGANNWGEVKRLSASDGAANDNFGIAVGISGDTVVVGARSDDFVRGSAYIYDRNRGGTDNWGEVKKLIASDGARGDQFGLSVGIAGNTVVVGAPGGNGFRGSTYVYERNTNGIENWGEARKLTAPDAAVNDLFGSSVGISSDTVVVGAFGDDVSKGSAHIYQRNKGGAGNWGFVKKLSASDGVAVDLFGFSVGISVDRVVVGAVRDDSQRGSAYVFERGMGGTDNWGEVQKLTASDGVGDDNFGISVGIDGDSVIVGANGDDSLKGSAYVFSANVQVNPVPLITSISPAVVVASSGAFTLTVNGSNFVPGSVVRFNGVDRPASVSTTQITATIPATDISGAGTATITVVNPTPGGGSSNSLILTIAGSVVSASAASFQVGSLAPEAIVAAFGTGMAVAEQAANSSPLPFLLLGTSVQVKDSAGVSRQAPLFFVSPRQINYLIPRGTASGEAVVSITSGDGRLSLGTIQITPVSLGLFTANSNGSGVAAANILRVSSSGAQVFEQAAQFSASTNRYVARCFSPGPSGETAFVVLYGTGIRGVASILSVSATIGSSSIPVVFAGSQGQFVGLDQINLGPIPRGLSGTVDIVVSVSGRAANTVQICVN